MITDYLAVGGLEVINTARLRAYLENVGSPFHSGSLECGCTSLTAAVLDPDALPYTTPQDPANPAPWFDADVPESASFLGFLPLSFDGVDDYPVKRQVTTAVRGGGSLGPARVQARTITVTGVLVGATCCGADYGLHWLQQALQGCTGSGCGGDCVTMYDCCPAPGETPAQYNARHRRTFRRVALVDGPTVTARNSATGSCAANCSGAELITVEFVLVAATPWAWTDETDVLDVSLPEDNGADCIVWCRPGDTRLICVDNTPCDRLKGCVAAGAACSDPGCTTATPPQPTQASSCASCIPLATNSACYSIDLAARPAWSSDVPMMTVFAGSSDLRHLVVSLYERTPADAGLTCDEIAAKKRCDPLARFEVGFVPSGGELLLDGQIGRAMVYCGGTCETSGSTFGDGGTPLNWPLIECSTLCICLETDAVKPPAADASFSLSVSGRGL